MYKGITLDCGLKIKNGEIQSEVDWDEIRKNQQDLIARLNAGPQPARIARERAAEQSRMKGRK